METYWKVTVDLFIYLMQFVIHFHKFFCDLNFIDQLM